MTRPLPGAEGASIDGPRPAQGDPGVGARLREIRGARSREEFGAELGVHRNTVARYESAERAVDTNFLRLVIEKNAGWSIEWLMTGRGEKHGAADGGGKQVLEQGRASYAARLDEELLSEVMRAIEGALGRTSISTDKRAQLIAAVYDDAKARGQVSPETVSRMVKLATSP